MAIAPAGGGPNTFRGPGGRQGGGGVQKGGPGFVPRGPAKSSGGGGANQNPLYNPLASLSGKALQKAAQGIANVQVNAPIADLRGTAKQNNTTSANAQKTDFGYYMQLAQAAKDAVASQQAQGSALQGQLQGINAGTQAQLGQLGQAASGGALARMNALGLDAGQTSMLGADAAHQQGTGALMGQAAQDQGALQSANATTATNTVRGATGLRGIEAVSSVARANALANQPINQKIADLQANRGALTATALGQLRTQERNYQIAQEGLQATAITNQQKLALTAAQDKAANALKALGIKTTASTAANAQRIAAANDAARIEATVSGQKITSARDAANQAAAAASLAERVRNDNLGAAYRQAMLNARNAAKGGPVKQLSGGDQARLNGEITRIEGLIQQAQAQKKAGTWKGSNNIRNDLEAHYSFPDAFVEAAYELLGYGALRPTTVKVLRNTYGLNATGGTFRGQPIRVKAQPVTPPSSPGPDPANPRGNPLFGNPLR